MLKFIAACGAALTLLAPSMASAAVIDFEDLENENIPTNYHGLMWHNWGVDTDAADGTGFEYGLQGGHSVASNAFGTPADIGMITQPFNFVGAYFNSAFLDNMTLTINGYDGVDLVHTATLTLSIENPIWFQADWGHITNMSFSASGGTPRPDLPFSGPGTHFVMEKFTWNESIAPAPEPATWAMMIIGFGAAGSAIRSARRRAAVV